MSKQFRNHIIFAVLAAIVFVIFVAMFMSTIPFDDWVFDLYKTSLIKVLLRTYLPLLFAGEALVYALKFVVEVCLCYNKSKLIKWLNVANLLAGVLIIAGYTLTFKGANPLFTFPVYSWISGICIAVIVGVAIASIVILVLDNKKNKVQEA